MMHVVDLGRIDAGALDRGADRMGGERRGGRGVERAAIGLADRRAGGGDDDGFAVGTWSEVLLRACSDEDVADPVGDQCGLVLALDLDGDLVDELPLAGALLLEARRA